MSYKLLTPEQTAELLGTQQATLSVWRSTGRYNLPFIKIGRLVRYQQSDIDDFLKRRTCQGHIDAMVESGKHD